MWHQLDLASADPNEKLLANWVDNPKGCVDPYWLLAAAMDYSGFTDKDPNKKLPVMVERANAHADSPPTFELQWHLRSDLEKKLISRVPRRIRRFQLDAPRTQGTNEAGTLSVPISFLEVPVKIAAVIDDGLPFAHPNLLDIDANGSILRPRFTSLWDQGSAQRPRPPWTKPSHIHFGALLSHEAIAALVGPHLSTLDEAAVYARAKYKHRAVGNLHGAGVTHLLAGNDVALPDGSRCDFAQRRPVPVIGVQLPEEGIADTAGAWLGFYALAALRHIVRESTKLAKGYPWRTVVNLSYGSMAGPHDGTSMLEVAMSALVDGLPQSSARLDIVLAAGNSRGRQIHAQRTVASGSPAADFRFLTPPDNPRESYVEFWIPATDDEGAACDPSTLEFSVTSPLGQDVSLVVGKAAVVGSLATKQWHAGVVFARRVAQGTRGTMVLLLVRPTRAEGQADCAPAGVWTVKVGSIGAHDVTIHAWVERNDLVGRRRRAQQAHFLADPTDPEHVNDDRTLSNVTNGPGVSVVGAVRASDSVVTAYSGRGYVDIDGLTRPKWFAAGDANAAQRGVLVPGFLGGTSTRMSGTSVAAPWAGRWMLNGGPPYAIGPTYDQADQMGPPMNRTIVPR